MGLYDGFPMDLWSDGFCDEFLTDFDKYTQNFALSGKFLEFDCATPGKPTMSTHVCSDCSYVIFL